MNLSNRPRRGFWYQVWRPFRALGRGNDRVLEFFDLISIVVNVGRAVLWLFVAWGASRRASSTGDVRPWSGNRPLALMTKLTDTASMTL
ncbi:hypothetical protein [Cellulomonas sp. PhB143]|uniref:hypothetical protein n=1 Tax=Cellulomonas sp. PhB143 TaxID=2485186 RepID=UPI000FA624DB|nr:hypothetical protein [Cellulomonas sp. PhB143]ROS73619.1 hypothetical protein EDF32_2474 [Cellulomonas sp. PhB143]